MNVSLHREPIGDPISDAAHRCAEEVGRAIQEVGDRNPADLEGMIGQAVAMQSAAADVIERHMRQLLAREQAR